MKKYTVYIALNCKDYDEHITVEAKNKKQAKEKAEAQYEGEAYLIEVEK